MRAKWQRWVLWCIIVTFLLVRVAHGADVITPTAYKGVDMSIDKQQLRGLIRDTLSPLELWSEDAEELLMLTCAVESDLGTYIRQIDGPALGIFMMEPATYKDIWENYLYYNLDKQKLVLRSVPSVSMEESLLHLEGSLIHQIVMARIHYLRVPKKLPPKEDVRAMASYHKKYYNTRLGKSTIKETIKKYKRYVLD